MNRLAHLKKKEQEFWQDVAQNREDHQRRYAADLQESIAFVRRNYTFEREANIEIERLTLKNKENLKKAMELNKDDMLFLSWIEAKKVKFGGDSKQI